ncbi:BXL5 [Symbiodinium sp. CCMP2592]|nr:BXL5 [Symbiodinium sp. CCMP2592]
MTAPTMEQMNKEIEQKVIKRTLRSIMTLMDLEEGEELGGDDDASSTQPGTPPPAGGCNETAGDYIDPSVPAAPAPGTPELGDGPGPTEDSLEAAGGRSARPPPYQQGEAPPSSSDTDRPENKKLRVTGPQEVSLGDELTDASMEEPPLPPPSGPPHPYTPVRNGRGPRPVQSGAGWMDALQQIHQSLQDLHTKADTSKNSQDRAHAELIGLRADLHQQEVRTEALEATTKEHTQLHEGTLLRVAALERQFQNLQQQERERSRSPPPAGRDFSRGRSPSMTRSPRDDRDPLEDLELVIGGWNEARRGDVEHEVKQIFQRLNMEDRLHEVIIPYVRVNVCRVALKFPPNAQNIRAQRAFQTHTLDKLKGTKFMSGITGSKNNVLWMTKNRTPEDRNKIRSLVQTKEFYIHVKYGDGRKRETPEIDWRGRVVDSPTKDPSEHRFTLQHGMFEERCGDVESGKWENRETWDMQVVEESDRLLDSDHRLVSLCVGVWRGRRKRQRQRRSQCGKWLVDYTKAVPLLNAMGEKADLNAEDLCESDFLDVSRRSCFRPRRFRFVDTSEIKGLIRMRKSSSNPGEKRELGREIVQKRADAKKSWRTDLLDRAASGGFQVISYFKRKQSISASQLEYCLRVGGTGPAVGGLQAFYRQKYAPDEPAKLTSPMHLYDAAVGCNIPGPSLITREEVEHVLTLTKSGKSCGNDAAPYEFWSAAIQSEACEHLLELLNDILLENVEMPTNWMLSQVVLLPKTKEPCEPKQYRPIVLAATLSKLFTKVLLLRLRSVFPHMVSGQLSSQVGAQALDGLITQAEVALSFANVTWRQRLKRGVLQGSAYSAELFARTLDHYLTPLLEEWGRTEVTWVRASDGTPLFAIIFADDILLLATSTAQLVRMLGSLQDCLQAIGLHLARQKCQLIRSPDLPPEPVQPRGFPEPIKEVDSFVFLGILVGFAVTCQMTLAARLRMATNSFFGYLGFLARAKGSLTKRLHLLDSFMTSRWRWLSAAVRPLFAVAKQLRTLQTHFLVSMARLAHDPLQTSCENWVARRRGAKMAAQACGHRPWGAIHLRSFMNYWGHAARLDPHLKRPIQIAIQVRDEAWRRAFPTIRRKVGRWPNTAYSLTLLWRRCRHSEDPATWDLMAANRQRWQEFTLEVFSIKNLLPDSFYPNLHQVDLCHRCLLLRTGDRFWLLPQTHPPIDPPYQSSYQVVENSDSHDEVACFCVACDGSKKGRKLGGGVALIPPYGEVPRDVVVCGYPFQGAPVTNVRAELLAAIKAVEKCLQLLDSFPNIPVQLITDSAYVLQVLEGGTVGFAHVSLQAGLCMLWHRCRGRVHAKHVHSHKGHALNEIADKAAKEALDHPQTHYFMRRMDYSRAYLPLADSPGPPPDSFW